MTTATTHAMITVKESDFSATGDGIHCTQIELDSPLAIAEPRGNGTLGWHLAMIDGIGLSRVYVQLRDIKNGKHIYSVSV